jgi:hypothetical protein
LSPFLLLVKIRTRTITIVLQFPSHIFTVVATQYLSNLANTDDTDIRQLLTSPAHKQSLRFSYDHFATLQSAVRANALADSAKMPALLGVVQAYFDAQDDARTATAAAAASTSASTTDVVSASASQLQPLLRRPILILSNETQLVPLLHAALQTLPPNKTTPSSDGSGSGNADGEGCGDETSVIVIDESTAPQALDSLLRSDMAVRVAVAPASVVWRSADFPWARVGAVVFYDSVPAAPPLGFVKDLIHDHTLVVHALTTVDVASGDSPSSSNATDATAAMLPVTLVVDDSFVARNKRLCSALTGVKLLTRTLVSPLPTVNASAASATASGVDIILDEGTCVVVHRAASMVAASDAGGGRSDGFYSGSNGGIAAVELWINELAALSLQFSRCFLFITTFGDDDDNNGGGVGGGGGERRASLLSSPLFLSAQLRLAASLRSDFPLDVTVQYVTSHAAFAAAFATAMHHTAASSLTWGGSIAQWCSREWMQPAVTPLEVRGCETRSCDIMYSVAFFASHK